MQTPDPGTGELERSCWGRFGDTWAEVFPECELEARLDDGFVEGTPWGAGACDLAAPRSGVDEVRCTSLLPGGDPTILQCFGLLTDLWVQVFPECHVDASLQQPGWTEVPVWPQDSCAASAASSGWDDVRCVRWTAGPAAPYSCFGRIDSVWVKLEPDCFVDQALMQDSARGFDPWPQDSCAGS